MLGWLSFTDSPVPDEVKQIPAGVSNWNGEFGLYRVTPPLVRLIANLPLVLSGTRIDWQDYPANVYYGQETTIGRGFIAMYGMDVFRWYTYGRLLCIPFSLIGGFISFQWSRRLYGNIAGLITLTLWCFSPMLIAHGHYITTDMAVTSLGLWACYCFWKWFIVKSWRNAAVAGIALGLAVLAKTTVIVFFAIWPTLVIAAHVRDFIHHRPVKVARDIGQVFVIWGLALYFINLGYAFTGSFTSLDKYTFKSKVLAGEQAVSFGQSGGNRFRDTFFQSIPVPLPADFVSGIDWQKADFESETSSSYLLGTSRKQGWWYYYIVGLAVKEPLGIWLLMALAAYVRFSADSTEAQSKISSKPVDMSRCPPGHQAWVIGALALSLFVFVSAQTGLSRHVRYVMPMLPFLYILAGSVAKHFDSKRQLALKIAVSICLIWVVVSSSICFPYSTAYFNETIGTQQNASLVLTGSNIDWGQDMFRVQKWLSEHPNAQPLHYRGDHVRFDVSVLGDIDTDVPIWPSNLAALSDAELENLLPRPGWYAISVNALTQQDKRLRHFRGITPVETIGRSTVIFHLTEEDVGMIRREFATDRRMMHFRKKAGELNPDADIDKVIGTKKLRNLTSCELGNNQCLVYPVCHAIATDGSLYKIAMTWSKLPADIQRSILVLIHEFAIET